ncbi:extracellular solute-binding protein, partial [Myxococcota bacterium]|nr:extracellular solute-binding protein [Myxococcota bacterium]
MSRASPALPFALAAALLASAPAEAVELTIWHAYRGDERAALEALLVEYDEAHPEVELRPLALAYESFVTKLEAAAPRGNGPDLFIGAHERVGQWSATGLVAPLTLDTSGLHPATVAALTYDGQLYGVPLAYKCLALYYNTELVPTPPRTTDELVAQAVALTRGDTFGLVFEADAPYFFAPFMHGFGGGVFDAAGAPSLASAENAAALGFVADLARVKKVIPEEPTGALVTQLFNDGKA